jgi:putative ABC transport system permease protein
VLAPYGGLDAHGREHQQSHRYLSEEFRQLGRMSRIFPSIFLSVAMFLLNVVVGRLVQTQRDQIAALKAFGYSNLQVGIHYLKIVLFIAVLGALFGLLLGGWMGRGLTDMYMIYYHFPTPRYEVEPALAAAGVAISCGTAALGTLVAVRRAALLPPAEAMRPEPPARYQVSFIERLGLKRWLDQPSRMILRNLARRPVRTALSTVGIAASCAILMVSSFFWDAIQHVMHVQFQLVQQEDIAVTFLEPTSGRARHELARLPGVRRAEGYRTAPVRLVNGQRSYRTVIQGLEPGAKLRRVLDDALVPCEVPEAGLVLTAHLAREILDVREGDEVTVEVLELDHPVRRVRVVRLVEEYIGVSGYMSLPALNRLLGEGDAISGAHLAVEPGGEPAVFAALDERPRVAGALSRKGASQAFRKTMAEQMRTFAFFNTILASSIALGVVYNAARIALAERGRELASLRVLGFTRGEVSLDPPRRAGHLHRAGAAAGHAGRLRAGPPDRPAAAIRPVPVSGDHPGAYLCVGRHLRGGRGRGQRAGGATAHRPPGHGGRFEDKGIRQCQNQPRSNWPWPSVHSPRLRCWPGPLRPRPFRWRPRG